MKKNIALTSGIIFFILFFIFTALILTVDVQPIGPNNSTVGLATINSAVADALEYNEIWYNVSEYVGYIPLAIAAAFAFLGLFQAIQRKSLFKIDRYLFVIAGFYVAVLSAYIIFEIFEINYRPVLIDGKLEASFPSSHTMLAICILSTAIFEFHTLLKNRKAYLIFTDIFCIIVGAVILIGRLLSGVHWLSDIIAGILLSVALVCFFIFASLLLKERSDRKIKNKENTVND